jgi:hypothetical protein
MQAATLQSVTNIFRRRPALFNFMDEERSGETRALDAGSRSVHRQTMRTKTKNGKIGNRTSTSLEHARRQIS